MRLYCCIVAISITSTAAKLLREGAPFDHAATDALPVDPSDRYIVTLKPGVDAAKHVNRIHDLHLEYVGSGGKERFKGITHEYNISSEYIGYAGHFDRSVVQALQSHQDVEKIEPDQIWDTTGMVEQPRSLYPLSLISHRHDKPHGKYNYVYDSSAGQDTTVYVVDSGISVHNVEFEGRATFGINTVDPEAKEWDDDYGHGTHIAGIIGSRKYGVAKKCKLIAVKVVERDTGEETQAWQHRSSFNAYNIPGLFSHILDGYKWAVNDIIDNKNTAKALVNLALYGPYNSAWSKAVDLAASKGVTTVVAAGNMNQDASTTSPGASKSAITVSATDKDRVRADFANWGPAVDLFAPGVHIKSTGRGGRLATAKGSGTSQAAAYVAGLVAYFKSMKDLPDARATKEQILQAATSQVVQCPTGGKAPFAYNESGK